jgi:hypothetical protein
MLQTQTVADNTYALLKRLMNDANLSSFFLAGGTNLALRLGHRSSIDLDLFSMDTFDASMLAQHLTKSYKFEPQLVRPSGTVMGWIEGVKIDIIAHKYMLLKDIIVEDSIRLYSLEDIIAMKLNAISDNGTRLKDFVDIAFLSSCFSLKQMVQFYTEKYKEASIRVYRSIPYFNDIDFSITVTLTNNRKFNRDKIQCRILQMIKYEDKIFDKEPI